MPTIVMHPTRTPETSISRNSPRACSWVYSQWSLNSMDEQELSAGLPSSPSAARAQNAAESQPERRASVRIVTEEEQDPPWRKRHALTAAAY